MDPRSWIFVLERACPECGYDGSSVTAVEAPAHIRAEVAGYRSLVSARNELVARRPAPDTWSALEYACHVRDAAVVLTDRATLILRKDEPTFATWDEDDAAVRGRYDRQDPDRVVYELAVNAGKAADLFDHVRPESWTRAGTRSGDGARFTLDMLPRYLLHELIHHRHDIAVGYEKLATDDAG